MAKLPSADAGGRLKFGQLEQLMRWMLEVEKDRESALTARMRLFRTRGFPIPDKSASKARFEYDLDATIQTALAFLMMDAMVPQEATPATITALWPEIRTAMARAFKAIRVGGGDAAPVTEQRPILVLRPRNLAVFSQPKTGVSGDEQQAAASDARRAIPGSVVEAGAIGAALIEAQKENALAGLTLIDLQSLAEWLRVSLMTARWATREAFDEYGG